jgi:glycosyltransferase involved in cell wall biosynthesis
MHHGFTERKLKVIYNSINYDLTLEKRESSLVKNYYADFFNNSNKTIVYIGRLTKYKKLGILIEALHTLKLKGKNYNLMLIGDGTERLELEKMTNKLKINACFFGPCYSEEQISQLLSNADLCVSPGNVGLTAVHAMSYGTPVCTHDNFSTHMPEFEIIKPNKTGCFYSLDKNNLAETIVDWFENNQNREEIRKECYNIIDKYYNPDYQVKVMKEALKAINQN